MLAVKKSRKRKLALSPASAISRGTSIADATAGRRSVVGTMIASAWLGSAGLSFRPTADLPIASASADSSISMLMVPPPRVSLFSLFRLGPLPRFALAIAYHKGRYGTLFIFEIEHWGYFGRLSLGI